MTIPRRQSFACLTKEQVERDIQRLSSRRLVAVAKTVTPGVSDSSLPLASTEPTLLQFTWRNKIYCLFDTEAPMPSDGYALVATSFAFVLVTAVVVSVVAFILESLPQHVGGNGALQTTEICCMVLFTFDFVMRLLFTPRRGAFFRDRFNWVDFASILPFYLHIVVSAVVPGEYVTSFIFLRVLRLVRVLRILKLTQYSATVNIVWYALATSFESVTLIVVLFFLCTILFSSLLFLAEQTGSTFDEESRVWVRDDGTLSPFTSIPHTFWFVMVTLTTVGYGDSIPFTVLGKSVTSVCIVVGALLLACPVIMIGQNFALAMNCRKSSLAVTVDEQTIAKIQQNLRTIPVVDQLPRSPSSLEDDLMIVIRRVPSVAHTSESTENEDNSSASNVPSTPDSELSRIIGLNFTSPDHAPSLDNSHAHLLSAAASKLVSAPVIEIKGKLEITVRCPHVNAAGQQDLHPRSGKRSPTQEQAAETRVITVNVSSKDVASATLHIADLLKEAAGGMKRDGKQGKPVDNKLNWPLDYDSRSSTWSATPNEKPPRGPVGPAGLRTNDFDDISMTKSCSTHGSSLSKQDAPRPRLRTLGATSPALLPGGELYSPPRLPPLMAKQPPCPANSRAAPEEFTNLSLVLNKPCEEDDDALGPSCSAAPSQIGDDQSTRTMYQRSARQPPGKLDDTVTHPLSVPRYSYFSSFDMSFSNNEIPKVVARDIAEDSLESINVLHLLADAPDTRILEAEGHALSNRAIYCPAAHEVRYLPIFTLVADETSRRAIVRVLNVLNVASGISLENGEKRGGYADLLAASFDVLLDSAEAAEAAVEVALSSASSKFSHRPPFSVALLPVFMKAEIPLLPEGNSLITTEFHNPGCVATVTITSSTAAIQDQLLSKLPELRVVFQCSVPLTCTVSLKAETVSYTKIVPLGPDTG
ncbi:Potassium voltage-gated channel protein Shab [Diplonema papillatum]|nr:Potassium voltage-gated channel protein Shab [Diplonema papillatum]